MGAVFEGSLYQPLKIFSRGVHLIGIGLSLHLHCVQLGANSVLSSSGAYFFGQNGTNGTHESKFEHDSVSEAERAGRELI